MTCSIADYYNCSIFVPSFVCLADHSFSPAIWTIFHECPHARGRKTTKGITFPLDRATLNNNKYEFFRRSLSSAFGSHNQSVMADYLALELARGQGSHADVAVVVQGRLGLHARACRWAALSRADLARAGRGRGTHTIGGGCNVTQAPRRGGTGCSRGVGRSHRGHNWE